MSLFEEKKYLKTVKFKKYLNKIKTDLFDKKILIYGAGILFETAYKTYNFNTLNIIGISDMKFNAEDSPKIFLGLKTYRPDEINNLNLDCILVAVKEYGTLVDSLKTQYPSLEILPLIKKNEISTFMRRNVNHNKFITKRGLHCKMPLKLNSIQSKLIDLKQDLKYRLNLLEIPQIEFTLTTKCTLQCKHCSNYMPFINPNEHSFISIEDFKIQLNNLLNAVYKVKNLILIGGEPLLVKNLHEYLDFAAGKRKIEKVWIITNGTLTMDEKLIEVSKKYRNKVIINISNYSKNEKLQRKLKHEKLFTQIKEADLKLSYTEDNSWVYISPLSPNKKRERSPEYFKKCNNNCVAVFKGKVYVCPSAAIFEIKNYYIQSSDEIIDLNIESKPRVLKRKLIDFYSKDYFAACSFCEIVEDRQKERVMPAIQLEKRC